MSIEPRAYVTYFDQRYAARAVVMLRSLRRHDPGAAIFALCFDEPAAKLVAALGDDNIVVVDPKEVYAFDPDLARCRDREMGAFYATHKAVLALYALRQRPDLAAVIHIDADLWFCSSLAPLFEEIGAAAIAITPHRFATNLERAKWFGHYNAGFIYWRNDPVGRRCLSDYRDDCIRWCERKSEPDGRFMNQGYLNDWPERYAGVHVIAHPGMNLAPWNVATHSITKGADILVDGRPLVFFHFSGLICGDDGIWRTGYTEFARNLVVVREVIYRPYLEEVEDVDRWAHRLSLAVALAEPVWAWSSHTVLLSHEEIEARTNYSLGQAVEFWEEFSRLYMRGDWGPTEAWGVRTDGPKAELVLRLIHTGTRPLLLKALVRPYLLPWRKTLSVDVAVNDEAVARWEFSDPTYQRNFHYLTARIPPERHGSLRITFAMPEPESAGPDADGPVPGLGFQSLCID